FGHNFDANIQWDREFIDSVHFRDEEEIARGAITPTHLFAILSVHGTGGPRQVDGRTPESCVHRTDALDPIAKPSLEFDDLYKWNSWPHSPQSQLEIMCERMAACERKASGLATTLAEARGDFEWLAASSAALRQEFEERTHWALRLDSELTVRTEW